METIPPRMHGMARHVMMSVDDARMLLTLIYIQQDATLHSLFISGNCSTCSGWYLHPSSGAHTTVSTASGTCQTVTATCRYCGRVGTAVAISEYTYDARTPER